MKNNRYSSFAEFWPFYIHQHSRSGTRQLHFVGTTLALGLIGNAIVEGPLWSLILAPVVGYGSAWIGHFFIEKNKPATFQYPWWSFIGDVKMYGLMWRGRMTSEMEKTK